MTPRDRTRQKYDRPKRDGQKRDGEKLDLGQQVEGRRAVRELLVAGKRRINEIWLSGDVEEIEALAETAHARVRRVPADQLERKARTTAPQGVVALAAPIVPADVDSMLEDPAAFLVALDGVTDPQNLGAVMRTAETTGATGMHPPAAPRRRSHTCGHEGCGRRARVPPRRLRVGDPRRARTGRPRARVVCRARRRWRHVGLRPARRGPAARAGTRCRRPRPVAARAFTVRGGRVDPHARTHRVAQRQRGCRDRLFGDRATAQRRVALRDTPG